MALKEDKCAFKPGFALVGLDTVRHISLPKPQFPRLQREDNNIAIFKGLTETYLMPSTQDLAEYTHEISVSWCSYDLPRQPRILIYLWCGLVLSTYISKTLVF